jgi:PAS domain S-box-containing protein
MLQTLSTADVPPAAAPSPGASAGGLPARAMGAPPPADAPLLQEPVQLNLVGRTALMRLMGIGLLEISGVWLAEAAFDVLRWLEAVGYAVLIGAFGALLLATWRRVMSPVAVQRVLVTLVQVHLLAGVVLPWIWPRLATIDQYVVASVGPWLLGVQVLQHLCFSRRTVLLLTLPSVAAMLLPPTLVSVLGGAHVELARQLRPLAVNFALAQLTLGAVLFVLARQLARLAAWAPRATAHAPQSTRPAGRLEVDEVIDRRTAALQALFSTARDREAELRAMLQAFPGHIVAVEDDWTCSFVNAQFAALVGRPEQEIIGLHLGALFGPERFAEAQARRERVLARGEPERFECRFTGEDGVARDLLETHFAVRTRPDGPARHYLVGIDISERKLTEEALARAKAEAERANAEKSQFLSRMSHELRTPLNAVLALSQLLRAGDSDLQHQERDHLRTIEHAARHLVGLIDDALDVSRIEQGTFNVRHEVVVVDALADDVVRSLASTAALRRVRLELRRGHRNTLAMGDSLRVRQVLFNLVSNAIKYNRDGGEVVVGLQARADKVEVVVDDTGPGLDALQQTQLFTPYNRLDAEHGPVPGTGIGLSISRQLARLMGGDITVDSAAGAGCRFTLRLVAPVPLLVPEAPTDAVDLWLDDLDPATAARPCEEATTLGLDLDSAPALDGAPARSHHADFDDDAPGTDFAQLASASHGRPARVLYIEDNEINQLVFRACLARRPNLSVEVAGDGASGLACARRLDPDLIVLDLNLPDVDGLELARHLFDHAGTRRPRIALLTADATAQTAERALSHGIDRVWHKPFDAMHLLDDLEHLLEEAGSGTA